MNRKARVAAANQTIEILERGFYEVAGQRIDIREDVKQSLAGSVLYRPDEFDKVFASPALQQETPAYRTTLAVQNATVLEAAGLLLEAGGSIGCLNFASARNPGGGFLNGSLAQEESIAVSSALYPTLMQHFEMYEFNRARETSLYSDYMIFSPGVVFFRDDRGELLRQPFRLSIVTSPAVNVGAIKTNRPHELAAVEATMLRRMEKVLSLFVHHGVRHLLLGAWGCGVFQNNSVDIARWFAHFLAPGRKFDGRFDCVVFAVYDRGDDLPNFSAFQRQFAL